MLTLSMRRTIATVGVALCGGLARAACGGGSSYSGGNDSSPAASPADKQGASKAKDSPKPKPKAAAPKVLLQMSGSGIQKTEQFKTGSNWRLAYSFDCSNFGGQGNFAVTEFTDGQMSDVLVNELKASGNGTSPVYDAGTHHLEINSECNWKVTVTG
jgi:hypothetical protein